MKRLSAESHQDLSLPGTPGPYQDQGKEFNPLEGVTKHWTQARLCFQALRNQFPDTRTTVTFIENAVQYATCMPQYQTGLLEQVMDHPGDIKYAALVGIVTNLMTCSQLSEPIRAVMPHPANHSGYDNSDELKRNLIPCLYSTDILVSALGLIDLTQPSPFAELAPFAQRRNKGYTPPRLSDV